VNVQTTIAGVKDGANLDLGLGAIDISGIATSLLSKLSAAQTSQTGGQLQTGGAKFSGTKPVSFNPDKTYAIQSQQRIPQWKFFIMTISC